MSAMRIVRSIGVRADPYADVIRNEVRLHVLDRAELNAALEASGVRLPARVAVVEAEELMTPAANIYAGYYLDEIGGSRICTAGFTVKSAHGNTGVTTAGHCPNNVETSSGVDLDFINEWFVAGQPYDFQWHLTPGLLDQP